jgi:L-alanine-DL-glutamate epimerase-like enolase superfamily enzyme
MDLMGRALAIPVHTLLGGCYRDRIRIYASLTFNIEKPHLSAKEAIKYVEEGFTALKFGWGQSPETSFGLNPRKDLEIVKQIREAIGDDIDLLIDVGRFANWTAPYAIKMIRALEKYNIYWLEEPLPPEDIDGYIKLTQTSDTLIATGEHEYSRYGFKDLITRGAADVVQPDITKAGGLSEAKKIADMAYAWNILCVPHSWSTAINTVASSHLVASMPNGSLLEFMVMQTPLMYELLKDPFELERGYLKVPKKPGLGIELNENTVEDYTYKV